MVIQNKVLNSLYEKNELIKVSSNFSSEEHLAGEGKKGFLIVVSEEEATDENIEFLSKIFKAIGIDLKTDTFIFKVKFENAVNISIVQQSVEFSQIFFFGMHPKKFGFNLAWQKYIPTEWSGYRMLAADGLVKISSDDKLKRMLWNALKGWK